MRAHVGVAVVLAVTASSSSWAFLCTRTPGAGPSVAWNQRQVTVHRSGAGEEVDADAVDEALRRGCDEWSRQGCTDLELALGPPTTKRIVGFDWQAGSQSPENQNIVVFRNDTPGDDLDRWVHTFGALAITTVTFESTSGRLLDADIEVNDISFEFTACDAGEAGCVVEFDLQNTLTHELGHVIGLDHPPASEAFAVEATMFASASIEDDDKRDLGENDIEGLCTIYPAGDATGECYGVGRPDPPSVRFTQTLCASTGPDGVVVAVALLAFLRRRHRRVAG